MTRVDRNTVCAVQDALRRARIFNIGQLASELQCSIPNARLKLKLWGAITSYNRNGRFYALPEVPRFDRHGLWQFKDVRFSKHGNLKQTVVHFVTTSAAGLTGREIGDLLGLSPHSFLHHFRNCPDMFREKHGGIYVYFSVVGEIYEKQLGERCALIRRLSLITVSDSEAIMILIAVIKHHLITADEIMALPEINKSKISKQAMKNFMEYHGLVKKTPGLRH